MSRQLATLLHYHVEFFAYNESVVCVTTRQERQVHWGVELRERIVDRGTVCWMALHLPCVTCASARVSVRACTRMRVTVACELHWTALNSMCGLKCI